MQVETLNQHLTHSRHLARRFFGYLAARPLGPAEQQFVARYLDGPCAEMFWEQQPADQRHAVDVARQVDAALPGDDSAVRAALLHDVGKRSSRVGPVSRSIATVLDAAGFPITARMRSYRRHGVDGADDIAARDCDAFAVAFARFHPGPAPDDVDPARWQVLLDADG